MFGIKYNSKKQNVPHNNLKKKGDDKCEIAVKLQYYAQYF